MMTSNFRIDTSVPQHSPTIYLSFENYSTYSINIKKQ